MTASFFNYKGADPMGQKKAHSDARVIDSHTFRPVSYRDRNTNFHESVQLYPNFYFTDLHSIREIRTIREN